MSGPVVLLISATDIQRDEFAAAGAQVDGREPLGGFLEERADFQDNRIFVGGSEDGSDLAAAVGVVKGVVDLLRGDAEGGGFVRGQSSRKLAGY